MLVTAPNEDPVLLQALCPSTLVARGFTLIEVLIAIAIIAVLAAVALPSYGDYMRRAKFMEAALALSDMRARMEQYFLDNRSYSNAGACGVDPALTEKNVRAFKITCSLGGSGYTVVADGIGAQGMAGFSYSITESDAKKTDALPSGWAPPNPNVCWAARKDGSCS